MIDLHTHILPGFDDGAQTLEDALAMARVAVADGITTLAATPHNMEWPPDGYHQADVESATARLQAAFSQAGLTLKLVPGVEAYIVPDLVGQLESKQAFPLNGARYLLVELPLSAYPTYTEQALFAVQVRGYVPLLAHPERNAVILEDPAILERLVERGILAQVTAGSLLGEFGRAVQDLARTLLEHKMIHVIASDAHAADRRRPALSAAVAVAAGIVGQASAKAMVTTTPEAILRGETFYIDSPRPYKRGRRWFWQQWT